MLTMPFFISCAQLNDRLYFFPNNTGKKLAVDWLSNLPEAT